ncbi:MAG TPA: hypothetical protein PK992_04690 [Planctomycetaceae bacterium]|nr:hypothetical protein [Planctomycetaceae bacterium]
MNIPANRQLPRSLYAAAWKPVGSGIVVAIMFLVHIASSYSDAFETSSQATSQKCLELLEANYDFPTHRSVQLQLPVASLRDNNGLLTANAESFLRLLSRRMKSLSLKVRLTSDSADTEFSATIAATMMRETPLDSTQLSISDDGDEMHGSTRSDKVLTITITRLEPDEGELE